MKSRAPQMAPLERYEVCINGLALTVNGPYEELVREAQQQLEGPLEIRVCRTRDGLIMMNWKREE